MPEPPQPSARAPSRNTAVLTQADDFPVHQTPEPVALGPSDRNFYDRYFFNAFAPDGSFFLAAAFGLYPNINIADAHFSLLINGEQHCVHASRWLNWERMNLQVGPIRIRVLQALQRLELSVEPTDGIAASLVFEGRAFPIQEPRFTHRFGSRMFMDITRLTQNCRVSGWFEVSGRRQLLPAEALGTRDRSWGVRPLGAPDPQPLAPPYRPSVAWLWTPLHFADRSVFFHRMADETGQAWNTRAVVCPDGAGPQDMQHAERPGVSLLPQGERHPTGARVSLPFADGATDLRIEAQGGPSGRFHMKGIGYSHPQWGHGMHQGEQVCEVERFRPDELDLSRLENLHVQVLSRATLTPPGQAPLQGIGTFEYSIRGAHPTLGLP